MCCASFTAGVAKIDGTLPLGTPLAGYNHGERRVPYWPIPILRQYTTWMEPSTGVLTPTWVKAVVIDNGEERFCFVTLDGIGSDGNVNELAYLMAAKMGFTVKRENVIFSGAHTHSGPGAISQEFLWAVAPATDLLVPEIQQMFSKSMATAMATAEKNMVPAVIDIGMGELIGVTRNRRGPNPWVQPDTIDPHLGVIRIDTAAGKPLATIWNFAMHGTCYGPSNMQFSGDIMGAACDAIESDIGGTALFINSDAGDMDPTGETCDCRDGVCYFAGASKISNAVSKIRSSLKPTNQVGIKTYSQIIPFGPTNLNLTLARLDNCTSGGPLDICTICLILDCDANIHLPASWLEQNPRFTALRFDINGKNVGMVTIPGEALIEVGWWIRNATEKLGFDHTFLLGYSNNHMGYFATPNEYEWGGYESEMTFWGIGTAAKIRDSCLTVAKQVQP